jgi:hypothetical protein
MVSSDASNKRTLCMQNEGECLEVRAADHELLARATLPIKILKQRAVIEAVCKESNYLLGQGKEERITPEMIVSEKKNKRLARPRAVAAYLLLVEFGITTLKTGVMIGRDHSTAIGCRKSVLTNMEGRPALSEFLQRVLDRLERKFAPRVELKGGETTLAPRPPQTLTWEAVYGGWRKEQ